MFRSPRYLEKKEISRVILDTPITLPGNGQHQTKTGYKFTVRDRNIVELGGVLSRLRANRGERRVLVP